eukprot:UN10695
MINNNITQFKTYVEDVLGCQFITATLLREPFERQLSHMYFRHINSELLPEFVQWNTNFMSNYLMFNFCATGTELMNHEARQTATEKVSKTMSKRFMKLYWKEEIYCGALMNRESIIDYPIGRTNVS